jgi:hypothetical protein
MSNPKVTIVVPAPWFVGERYTVSCSFNKLVKTDSVNCYDVTMDFGSAKTKCQLKDMGSTLEVVNAGTTFHQAGPQKVIVHIVRSPRKGAPKWSYTSSPRKINVIKPRKPEEVQPTPAPDLADGVRQALGQLTRQLFGGRYTNQIGEMLNRMR